MITSLEAP
ncbi:hypothetical protein CGLO_00291 [Colletotrichum gloeosporioides Cg-14]|uniref:Uncharacterized protein n=1 Tax=Colletotrichum gloeosporioides (strain Cg-14) TaxID=1237896 RepID=T0L3I5_COLGC|nr:hypothetical protein CGLO_00291 [Colletotrichum gloeosporioides Cg-14]